MNTISIHLINSENVSAKDFIDRVIAFARKQGVDQATLAVRSGISPESLSRLKKQGGCRLTTALRLASSAGFKKIDIIEQPTTNIAASIAARKLSAGRRVSITAEELIFALVSGKPKNKHKVHVLGFFEELPIASAHDVILDEGLNYKHLVSIANKLGAEGETIEWLKEMACDSLA